MGSYIKKKGVNTYRRKQFTIPDHDNIVNMNNVTTAHRASLCAHLIKMAQGYHLTSILTTSTYENVKLANKRNMCLIFAIIGDAFMMTI